MPMPSSISPLSSSGYLFVTVLTTVFFIVSAFAKSRRCTFIQTLYQQIMRKIYLLMMLVCLCFRLDIQAQITITNTTFPVVGNLFNYSIDINPTVNELITPPGFNQSWNFSGLQTDQTYTRSFMSPSTGAHTAIFPGADLLVVEAGREMYYNVTSNLVEFLGYFGSDPINIGINLPIKQLPPIAERVSPVEMFGTYMSSSGSLTGFRKIDLPPNSSIWQLPFIAATDSLRIRTSHNQLGAVDGWGTLSIPGGCFEVLREKRTIYVEKRVDAKVAPLGWLDVTDQMIQNAGFTTLGVDTIVEFHFLTNTDRQEIAILTLNRTQSAVVKAQFKTLSGGQLAISNVAATPESCPNANNGRITITATGGAGTLTYSISGPVTQTNNTGVFNGLPDGSYTVSVTSSSSPCPVSAMATVAAGVDAVRPTATCVNATLPLNGQQSIALNANELVVATDNCGVQSVVLSPASILASQIGQTIPVTAKVMDVAGNSSTCISQITISDLPAGWNEPPAGIGCADCTIDFDYSPGTGIWTGSASGANYESPYTADAMAFASRSLCGNGSITVQVTGVEGSGLAGVVMRESNTAGAKKAQLMTNLSSLSRREFRTTANGQAFPQQFPSQNRYWLRIERSGNQFSLYTSPNGVAWSLAGIQTIAMSNCIQMGLVATNAATTGTLTATFANVSYTGSTAP